MGPLGTPALTGYSFGLLLRKEQIRPNIWPEIP